MKKIKSIIILILIIEMLIPIISLAQENENRWDVSQNNDGSITAVLDNEGTLTLSGTGKMKKTDWYDKRSDIKKL